MTAVAQVPERLPVSMPGERQWEKTDRLLIVTDPEHGPITVRWRWVTPGPRRVRYPLWRCQIHGNQRRRVKCEHAYSAAVYLAEQLLGLTSVIPPNPRTPRITGP